MHPRDELWHRPPLAKELFLKIPRFRDLSRSFARFQPLLPYLDAQENVEEILEVFRVESETEIERRRQLWAVRYYLSALIEHCQVDWLGHTRGVSNY